MMSHLHALNYSCSTKLHFDGFKRGSAPIVYCKMMNSQKQIGIKVEAQRIAQNRVYNYSGQNINLAMRAALATFKTSRDGLELDPCVIRENFGYEVIANVHLRVSSHAQAAAAMDFDAPPGEWETEDATAFQRKWENYGYEVIVGPEKHNVPDPCVSSIDWNLWPEGQLVMKVSTAGFQFHDLQIAQNRVHSTHNLAMRAALASYKEMKTSCGADGKILVLACCGGLVDPSVTVPWLRYLRENYGYEVIAYVGPEEHNVTKKCVSSHEAAAAVDFVAPPIREWEKAAATEDATAPWHLTRHVIDVVQRNWFVCLCRRSLRWFYLIIINLPVF